RLPTRRASELGVRASLAVRVSLSGRVAHGGTGGSVGGVRALVRPGLLRRARARPRWGGSPGRRSLPEVGTRPDCSTVNEDRGVGSDAEERRDAVDGVVEQSRRERPDLDVAAKGDFGRVARAARGGEREAGRGLEG